MFLDDTSCNLSSINLVTLLHRQGEKLVFDYKMFERVIRIMITAMDIVIDEAHYPNERLTIQTRKFRTLGLGYANLGALLMRSGIAYDSDSGRDTAAAITAYMQAVAYHQSSEVAAAMGAFDRYAANAQHVRKVIAMHCSALDKVGNRTGEYGLMLLEAERLFNATYDKPVRNAQVTVLAPTGTIGLFMGCDTTGVEPDLALVKYKQIHGTKGSVEKIVNQSVEPALIHLGYSLREIDEIQEYILQHGNIAKCEAVAESHKAVFDTALGAERTISWKGHVLMMAAVQPFLSGAISKTINMPNSSTVDDVQGAYELAHSLGLKSMAIYRDGSKGSQPVNTSDKTATATTSTSTPLRKKLPQVCKGDRVKFALAGIEVYIHTGCFEDGTLGELFITASKSGSTLQGLLNSTAIGISVGLQYGVPLSTYVELLRHQKFEPAGPVKLPGLERTHFYSSILDCIAHWLEVTYLKIPVESTSSDNPFCSDCGTLMVRSGTCFKCGQCGTTTGCS
jgi:ribonucleoside-diphosphate reductase alpha chain